MLQQAAHADRGRALLCVPGRRRGQAAGRDDPGPPPRDGRHEVRTGKVPGRCEPGDVRRPGRRCPTASATPSAPRSTSRGSTRRPRATSSACRPTRARASARTAIFRRSPASSSRRWATSSGPRRSSRRSAMRPNGRRCRSTSPRTASAPRTTRGAIEYIKSALAGVRNCLNGQDRRPRLHPLVAARQLRMDLWLPPEVRPRGRRSGDAGADTEAQRAVPRRHREAKRIVKRVTVSCALLSLDRPVPSLWLRVSR